MKYFFDEISRNYELSFRLKLAIKTQYRIFTNGFLSASEFERSKKRLTDLLIQISNETIELDQACEILNKRCSDVAQKDRLAKTFISRYKNELQGSCLPEIIKQGIELMYPLHQNKVSETQLISN